MVVVVLALAVIASSVPLFGWVKREYVPTDVDEAEFEISYEGPEGMSLTAMDEVVQAMDREIRIGPGNQAGAADRGQQLPRAGEPGRRVRADRAARRAHRHADAGSGKGSGAGILARPSAATTPSAR